MATKKSNDALEFKIAQLVCLEKPGEWMPWQMNILGKLWGPELEATYPAQPHGVGPGATVRPTLGLHTANLKKKTFLEAVADFEKCNHPWAAFLWLGCSAWDFARRIKRQTMLYIKMFCMVIMPTKPALVFHSNNNLPFCCWHLWVLPPATCCKQIWCRAFLRDKLGRKLAYMTNELRQESFCFFSDRDTVTDIWKGWFPLAHLLLLVVWYHLTECKSVAQRCIFFHFCICL